MLARSWIAVLLLVNYLLIAGTGCMNRPEDQHERVLVQTSFSDQHVSTCRYLRMDGLEAFLNEALTTRYQQTTDAAPHRSISVVSGIDAHCLPVSIGYKPPSAVCPPLPALLPGYQPALLTGIGRAVSPPPQRA